MSKGAAKGAAGAIGNAVSKGGGSKASQSVDPIALGQAQLAANIGTAASQSAINNINTFSPYGSSVYTQRVDPTTGEAILGPGGVPQYDLRQTLSPELQNLFGTQTGLSQVLAGVGPGLAAGGAGQAQRAFDVANLVSPNLDLSAVPNIGLLTPGSFRTDVTGGAGSQAIPGAVTGLTPETVQRSVSTDFPSLVKQAQDAAYGAQTQYLDPQFAQSESSLRQRLADQGIEEGSDAFTRALGDFNRTKQAAYQQASSQAVAAGNEQQRALFGQAIAGGQFANQAAQQAFGQQLAAGQFTNQAQQQLFGQGMDLANLYNQAQLAASGQNLQATQANLARAQAGFGAPMTAAQFFGGLGQQALGEAGGMVNLAPTWPISIPTMGGSPATVAPANMVGAQQAATQQNQLANQVRQQTLTGLGSLGSSILGGGSGKGGGGGLFGSGGGLFSGKGGGSSIPSDWMTAWNII